MIGLSDTLKEITKEIDAANGKKDVNLNTPEYEEKTIAEKLNVLCERVAAEGDKMEDKEKAEKLAQICENRFFK